MGETMEITSFSVSNDQYDIDFPEFSGPPGCLLESVDFDELFVGIQFFDGDMLLELEMDPELLAELSTGDLEEDSATSPDYSGKACVSEGADNNQSKVSVSVSVSDMKTEKEKEKSRRSSANSPAKDREKTKKSPSSQAKKNNNNPGKRKTKVDWTPDLHRKFVKAVEQLGVDKAVPSRILELMGIRRLTRHNIASHLQKYRSHRKHLLEREAEAASWSLQKRQMRGAIGVVPPGGGGGGGKVKVHAVPTMGFPPPVAPPPLHPHAFQHLHVWGHPTGHHLEHQPMMPGWPKHLAPSPSPLLHYPPSPQVASWHSHHQHRFAPPLVQGFPPPHATMYKPEHGIATSATAQSSPNHPPLDSHPTKESIDDAIGDVLSKPWLPLPIGLKPPSMDIVMEELQRQGLPSILPSDSS